MKFLCKHVSAASRPVTIALVIAALGLYYLGLRPVRAVKYCHYHAQMAAKESLVTRSQADPSNLEFKQAVAAGLFVEQDYTTYYRNCIRAKGYEPN